MFESPRIEKHRLEAIMKKNSALDENSLDLKCFVRFKLSVILSGCVCFGFLHVTGTTYVSMKGITLQSGKYKSQ